MSGIKEKEKCHFCHKVEITVYYCCSAFDCGCQGLPIDPPFCSEECFEKWRYDQRPKQEKLPPIDEDIF